MYEIIPGIWIGNGSAGRNKMMLLKYGITNLLQIGEGLLDMQEEFGTKIRCVKVTTNILKSV